MFTESDQAIAPGARVGPYRILRRLAVGGMAELFLAHAVGPVGVERLVVLKQILPDLAEDPHFVEMFLNEARLASMLSHPNIVQVLDVGSAAGAYFLVMEYVHGRNVAAILREASQRGELPLACAVAIVDAVAGAVHYAHNATDPRGQPLGIVHRDVTPSNVIVSSEGAVKLTDFGIAKAVAQAARTRATAMKGKVGYMAPEQACSQRVDARTDVFALGVLLYELTTRIRCFSGDSDYVTLNRIVAGEYRRPSDVIAGYPAGLERIVRTALQPRPEDRYPSAAAMQSALASFSAGEALHPSADRLARYVEELAGFPPYPTVEPATEVARPSPEDPKALDVQANTSPRRGWSSWAIAASAIGGAGVAAATIFLATPRPADSSEDSSNAANMPPPAVRAALDEDAPTEPSLHDGSALPHQEAADPASPSSNVEAEEQPEEEPAGTIPKKETKWSARRRAKRKGSTRSSSEKRAPKERLFPP